MAIVLLELEPEGAVGKGAWLREVQVLSQGHRQSLCL